MPSQMIRLGRLADMPRDPDNARLHSPAQLAQLRQSIRDFGFTTPLLFDVVVRAGNGRHEALEALYAEGVEVRLPDGTPLPTGTVPYIDCTGWSPEQRRAYALADNRIAENATWNDEVLLRQLRELANTEFDMPALGFEGMEAELAKALAGMGKQDTGQRGSLASDFGAPPFSVFDTRQGYWQERRAQWEALTGNLSATKEGVLSGSTMLATINEGSSNFDPVLAELCMRWFCPQGGWVIDPFGGEQTKGVVAGTLGINYRATEIRADQVAVNEAACSTFDTVAYKCGSAEDIDKLVPERGFNFCFTSPPYYDLEVYSAEDMSALGTYEEFMAMYERIFAKCISMLADNAFLAVKIGEIRDKKTGVFRNFVGDNIAMFMRLGLHYYNEATIISPPGTAPQRARRYMESRKLAKLHQNLLVFVKGDVAKAVAACGPVTAVALGGGDE
jgi:hypothetical protein